MARIDPASATGAMALDTILRAFAPLALPEPFPINVTDNDRAGADPIFTAALRRMESQPHFVKLAIYPERESADWLYCDPNLGEYGEDLDQLEEDAEAALESDPSPTRRSYLEAALAAIDGFRTNRRNWEG